jgi:hypothetical protein
MTALDAFRSVDFNWTRQLRSIWRDPPYHLPSLHQRPLDEIADYFKIKTADPEPLDEPLGRVIVGPAGYGKTHLIGELRRRVWAMDGWFILLDFIGIKDFWSSVALGFLNSLQVRRPDSRTMQQTQYDYLVLKLADFLGISGELIRIAECSKGQPQHMMTEMAATFTRALAHRFSSDTVAAHRDVVTALILLISVDLDHHSVAHGWLQGMNFDPAEVRPLGFRGENSPLKVVQGLSWVMSLVGPILIAIDQIDAIVTASNSSAREAGDGGNQERKEAQSIVDALAQGLMDLHDQKRCAVTVVSCLEATWRVLQVKTSVAVEARYYPPVSLRALADGDVARGIVEARLAPAYEAAGFQPPYPTWPFAETAFQSASGFSPRQLLRACEEHRQRCIADGSVTELTTFDGTDGPPTSDGRDTGGLMEIYEGELAAAAIAGLMDANGEEDLRELLDGTLRLLEKHFNLPDDVDAVVQRDPDQKRPSLHGRLSFTFRSEGDREEHYCFRILGHTQAIAFQSRLKAAMTASGIDTALKFRHLFIIRRGDPPTGPKTAALVEQFRRAGGRFVALCDDDLRIFVALAKMRARELPKFDAWLLQERPLFKSRLFQEAGLCPPSFLAPPPSTAPKPPPSPPPDQSPTGGTQPGPVQPPAGKPAARPTGQHEPAAPTASRLVPIGHRYDRGALGAPVTLSADLLPRHVAVLAGPGSGKTVFMRRIVEEAALLGIPSILLDPNNDLSRLGVPWPARPESWSAEDAAKSEAYRAQADVVIWTPGVTGGNPITLNLLPDFASIDDPDELNQAVDMARTTLGPFLPGAGVKANRMQGVLAQAIRRFAARGGGRLTDLVALLADLPDGVSQDTNAQQLGSEIANQLYAAIAVNPLLQSAGEPLDPRTLFEGPNGKTRVSVINLAGLASDEARDSFVNRLQMSLFTFIKGSPSPTGRLYVIDEAQNFVPSGAGTACKASAKSLAAQARKYGLGMMFATQTPKGIDNKIVSNCTTHVYGRMGSSATMDAIHEMMAAKGGAADDIGKLSRGEFYFSTEGSTRPFKVQTPLCLSWHPANPLTADEVIEKARACRLRLAAQA